ncbi:hypothetical protein SLA2020_192100 [Shorea laevis]
MFMPIWMNDRRKVGRRSTISLRSAKSLLDKTAVRLAGSLLWSVAAGHRILPCFSFRQELMAPDLGF